MRDRLGKFVKGHRLANKGLLKISKKDNAMTIVDLTIVATGGD